MIGDTYRTLGVFSTGEGWSWRILGPAREQDRLENVSKTGVDSSGLGGTPEDKFDGGKR